MTNAALKPATTRRTKVHGDRPLLGAPVKNVSGVVVIDGKEFSAEAALRMILALQKIRDHWGEPVPVEKFGNKDVLFRKWMSDYNTLQAIAADTLDGIWADCPEAAE